MEKRNEKKVCSMNAYVTYGFWIMLLLFAAMMILSVFGLALVAMITGVLFLVSIFFVFVSSIKAIVPEKSMAYIALGISIVFILYILLSATVSILPSMLG